MFNNDVMKIRSTFEKEIWWTNGIYIYIIYIIYNIIKKYLYNLSRLDWPI